ncbi:hypothetical protein ACQBAR_13310 [Propionibacteriaceae bacterium Y1685]|uniref:hypothetical protein n=1 Tax=Microlunatus sp. Y1700 TaxID=3418487 RepID=UPI003B7D3124
MFKAISDAKNAWSDGNFSFDDVASGVDIGMEALSAFMDPAGALVGAVLGPLLDWVANNVSFIKEPLDLLAGDAAEVKAYSKQWLEFSRTFAEQGNAHVEAVRGDMTSWSGPAQEKYMAASKELNEQFIQSSKGAKSFSSVVQIVGVVVGEVRSFVWGIVKEVVIGLVTEAVIAAAAAIPSFGASLAAYTAWASAKVAMVMGKISKMLSKLCMKLSKLTRKIAPLSEAFAKAGTKLAKAAAKYGKQAGKIKGQGNKAVDSARQADDATREARRTRNAADAEPGNIDRQGAATAAEADAREARRQSGRDTEGIDQPKNPLKDPWDVTKKTEKEAEQVTDDPSESIQRL